MPIYIFHAVNSAQRKLVRLNKGTSQPSQLYYIWECKEKAIQKVPLRMRLLSLKRSIFRYSSEPSALFLLRRAMVQLFHYVLNEKYCLCSVTIEVQGAQSSGSPLWGGLPHVAPCSRLFISLSTKRTERGIEICFKYWKIPCFVLYINSADWLAAGKRWSCAEPCLTSWCTPTLWPPRISWMMVRLPDQTHTCLLTFLFGEETCLCSQVFPCFSKMF